MTDLKQRHGIVLAALAAAIILLATAGCGSGPESPTAPSLSSGGDSGRSSGGSGGGEGDGGSGGGSGGGGGDTGGGGAGGGGGGTGGGGGGTGGGGTGGGGGPGGGEDGGGGGGGAPPPGSSSGTLAIFLTDAPIDEIDELQVFFESVKVKPDGAPVERFASNIGLIDLLTLQDGVTELLGQEDLEPGIYQFIELLLDQDQSYVIETDTGEQLPLKIPSEKIKVNGGPFEVFEDGTTSVLVDFDAEKSLKKTGNGRYQLKPFVTIVEVNEE